MQQKISTYRSDLGRVRGLGSAKEGTHHWWVMKLTAIALIPLSIWFVSTVITLFTADQAGVQAWLKQPLQAIALLLFIGFSLHHSANGIQVVLEDYVHAPWKKVTLMVFNKLLHVALAAIAAFVIIT